MIPSKVRARIEPYLQNATDDCIPYHSLNNHGYGDIQYREDGKKRHYLAHRAAYEIANYCSLETKDVVMHSCDNPACVNPLHLSKGTHKDNSADKINKGRHAKGTRNGRYTHGHYSKYAPILRAEPPFESQHNRTLSLQTVMNLKLRISENNTKLVDIAREFGVKYQTVRDISAGRAYKNVTQT